jgi:hypothetical protein
METGSYIVYFFNRYGTKLKGLEIPADSVMVAMEAGHALLKSTPESDKMHKPVSFAVDRRIYNSLDSQD